DLDQTFAGLVAGDVRAALPGDAESLDRPELPFPADVQRLHDPGGAEIRLLARRLAGRAAYCALPSVARGRLRPALSRRASGANFGYPGRQACRPAPQATLTGAIAQIIFPPLLKHFCKTRSSVSRGD